MSVGTFADFLGQETQSTAAGESLERHVLSSRASSALRAEKTCTRSVVLDMRETNVTVAGRGRSRSRYSGGAPLT